ncbi:hypothetical protein AT984_02225 [Paucibacter sp. KCTC 42545]|nr:hypothetical protein AT984_02225 [Paucibacter sp. KCTC 42545]
MVIDSGRIRYRVTAAQAFIPNQVDVLAGQEVQHRSRRKAQHDAYNIRRQTLNGLNAAGERLGFGQYNVA